LVRLNCANCAQQTPISSSTLSLLKPGRTDLASQHRGLGCTKCLQSGYQGRQGIFELMPVTETICSMIIQKASAEELRREIRSKGHKDMFEHGLDLVAQGKTTLEEVVRVTRF
ncbi:MAG: hypothetical protein ACOCY9_00085, partial [Desulfohalobiaceae bacterium]